MMQIVVGSGFDSSNLCEGGLKGYEYAGVEILPQTFTVYDNGVAGARVSCTSGRGFCAGTARLEVDGVELGRALVQDRPRRHDERRRSRSRTTARASSTRAGSSTPTVIVDSQDDIGQQRTTTGVATLKSARPTPAGFSGTTVRAQALPVKNGTFAFKATCPLGTQGACTGTVSISSQKRVILRRGTRGSVYKVAAGKFSIAPGKTGPRADEAQPERQEGLQEGQVARDDRHRDDDRRRGPVASPSARSSRSSAAESGSEPGSADGSGTWLP